MTKMSIFSPILPGKIPRPGAMSARCRSIPGFMLSELKTAFLLGFKVYLPFLVIDMVISTVLVSMGMMMLPPALDFPSL